MNLAKKRAIQVEVRRFKMNQARIMRDIDFILASHNPSEESLKKRTVELEKYSSILNHSTSQIIELQGR